MTTAYDYMTNSWFSGKKYKSEEVTRHDLKTVIYNGEQEALYARSQTPVETCKCHLCVFTPKRVAEVTE